MDVEMTSIVLVIGVKLIWVGFVMRGNVVGARRANFRRRIFACTTVWLITLRLISVAVIGMMFIIKWNVVGALFANLCSNNVSTRVAC